MEKRLLGRTGLLVSRSALGALPLQRVSMAEAIGILRLAYDGGINFFDTARAYGDSEAKIGAALADVRSNIYIATKSTASSGPLLREDFEKSRSELGTDYIDLYQFHFAKRVPVPGDGSGLYEAMEELKGEGSVRGIGITAHSLAVALEAARSGLYDTVQFPLSYLSSQDDLQLVDVCRSEGVGLIAMKALSGGIITHAPAAYAFMSSLGDVLPIWGIQRESEAREFIALAKNPPVYDQAMRERVEKDRAELGGNFCRACGYCLPCPEQIEIPMIARMPQILRRMDPKPFCTDEWRAKMEKVSACVNCGACRRRCPYELDAPALLRVAQRDYAEFMVTYRS